MPTYTFESINVPAAAGTYIFISVNAVDAAGEAVGTYSDNDDNTHGFVANSSSGVTFDPPASSNTISIGITASGEIFGNYVDHFNQNVGFVDNNGIITTIDPILSMNTTVFGVTATGEVFGGYTDVFSESHGFIDNNGSFSTIDIPGATNTTIMGVNAAGEIVGVFGDSTDTFHGFIIKNGVPTTFNAPGAVNTFVVGVSASGAVVGTYDDSANNEHGYINNNGVIASIDVPGATLTAVSGINDVGEIVGYYIDSTVGHVHGFVDNNGVITTIDFPGAVDTNIQGINDAGEIFGYYNDSSGNQHGFVAQTAATMGPIIESISATTDDQATDLNASHLVTIILSTNEAMTVTGTPTLQLNDNEVAFYTGGSGTNALTFTYAVQFGDNVSDLQVTGLNLPSGSTIADQSDHALSGSVISDLGIQIDTTTVPSTSVQQEVLGLYAALYGRAADFGGYSYWVNTVGQQADGAGVTTANAGSTAVTTNDAIVLGQLFVNTQSSYFNSVYGGLSNSAFINALYVNIGGNAGDPTGIAYWASLLQQAEAGGQSVQAARAGLVGQFVHDLVDVNLNTFPGLTPAQFQAAVQRQDTIDNKIAVSLAYANASEQTGGAILIPQTVGDAAYQASATVLQDVTFDPATVTAAIVGINNAVAHQNLMLI
jgi:hypothetical protein